MVDRKWVSPRDCRGVVKLQQLPKLRVVIGNKLRGLCWAEKRRATEKQGLARAVIFNRLRRGRAGVATFKSIVLRKCFGI